MEENENVSDVRIEWFKHILFRPGPLVSFFRCKYRGTNIVQNANQRKKITVYSVTQLRVNIQGDPDRNDPPKMQQTRRRKNFLKKL